MVFRFTTGDMCYMASDFDTWWMGVLCGGIVRVRPKSRDVFSASLRVEWVQQSNERRGRSMRWKGYGGGSWRQV